MAKNHLNKKSRGVYFVGNDRVIDLCIAFLNSFRFFNPDMPLCLIPFRSDCQKLMGLKEEYDFSVFSNDELLTECDEFSLNFHNYKDGHYRKLAAWEGDFDEFIYIDIDTVVQSNFDFVFNLLEKFDFIVATSNIPATEKWTWKKSIYQSGELTEEQIKFAGNTGFIASQKTALSCLDILGQSEKFIKLCQHMNLYCFEQPLLNYLIVSSGKKYIGLNVLSDLPDYVNVKTERWAGEPGGKVIDGKISFHGEKDSVLFVHWAGKWQVYNKERKIIEFLKSLSIIPKNRVHVISMLMPYKKLWKHYRFLNREKQVAN